MTPTKHVLLDVDTGVDNTQTIILTATHQVAHVVGICCVAGNTSVLDVCRNTGRVLRLLGRTDIPVYRGAAQSLIGCTAADAPGHHGDDGLGGVPDPGPATEQWIQEEAAAQAIVRFSKTYPGALCVVCLGPLTNLALALRLDSGLGARLGEVVIMGGNMAATGSRVSVTADFNFCADPEAAHVVLTEVTCPIWLLPYDVSINTGLSWAAYDSLISGPGAVREFVRDISRASVLTRRRSHPHFYCCDVTAAAVALDRSLVRRQEGAGGWCVELGGRYTRGLSVQQWDGGSHVHLVTDVHWDRFFLMYADMINVTVTDK